MEQLEQCQQTPSSKNEVTVFKQVHYSNVEFILIDDIVLESTTPNVVTKSLLFSMIKNLRKCIGNEYAESVMSACESKIIRREVIKFELVILYNHLDILDTFKKGLPDGQYYTDNVMCIRLKINTAYKSFLYVVQNPISNTYSFDICEDSISNFKTDVLLFMKTENILNLQTSMCSASMSSEEIRTIVEDSIKIRESVLVILDREIEILSNAIFSKA